MQNPTADEQQKAVSVVLNQMRKKNLSGMLAAQRNGTLDEFLAPHLAEYWAKQRAKQNERPVSDRSGATPYSLPTGGKPATQRPVTMARPNAAPAAPTGGSADVNPRGIQIFRVVSEQVRAEPISAVKKDGLNASCAYVVTDPAEKEVYCWVGKNCSIKDEEFADVLAKDLAAKDLRSSRPVLRLKQLSGTIAVEHLQALTEIIFWQIITGVNPVSVSAELKQKCSMGAAPKNAALVALEYSTAGGGQYVPIADAALSDNEKGLLSRDILKPTRVVVVECGANSYVWIGAEVRAATVTPALDILRRRVSSQPGGVICQVRITSEPVVFTRFFGDSAPVMLKRTPDVASAPMPAAVEPVAAVPAEDNGAGTLSVSERMKRFSNPGSGNSVSANREPTEAAVAAITDSGPVVEVDPATLSVKERMALFKKDKPAAQTQPTKKQPIDIGVDVGLKEKKAMMESVLDPKKIHLNVVDGVGTARRSSFTVDDVSLGEVSAEARNVLDADLVVDRTPPGEAQGQPLEVADVKDNSHSKDTTTVNMDDTAELTEDGTSSAENAAIIPVQAPTVAPPHVHKKHIPKFTAVESSPVIPIARKSIGAGSDTSNNKAGDDVVFVDERQEGDQAIKEDAKEISSAGKTENDDEIQADENTPTVTENELPNEVPEVIIPEVPTPDKKTEARADPVHVNITSPVHEDPDITTAYTPMEEKNDAKANPPAEVEAGCCTIM